MSVLIFAWEELTVFPVDKKTSNNYWLFNDSLI
jgi:hypothetical protein